MGVPSPSPSLQNDTATHSDLRAETWRYVSRTLNRYTGLQTPHFGGTAQRCCALRSELWTEAVHCRVGYSRKSRHR
jgi:hypothetical protein